MGHNVFLWWRTRSIIECIALHDMKGNTFSNSCYSWLVSSFSRQNSIEKWTIYVIAWQIHQATLEKRPCICFVNIYIGLNLETVLLNGFFVCSSLRSIVFNRTKFHFNQICFGWFCFLYKNSSVAQVRQSQMECARRSQGGKVHKLKLGF